MYRKNTINIILGWVVFLIAFITYLLTLEPTASWWDCSEFIISAYKLEVGHPPGAPLHIILGRFFSLFASDVSQVAYMVNLMSALASAGTVMLLYWSIVHLARKLFPEQLSKAEQIAVWGSGLVGALAFTFTDSFWFSAVEGEVYALSSFFTAAVFWAILKWENEAGQKYADRWLILIAYLMGLSTGVHLLNLLAIPAIGLVYYFKKYEFSWKGVITALFISALVLVGIQYVLIPDIPKLAFLFDLFFVNTLGLPFQHGHACIFSSARSRISVGNSLHPKTKTGGLEHCRYGCCCHSDWIFHFCTDSDSCRCQSAHEPKPPRQCFCPATLPEPGTIRKQAFTVRQSLQCTCNCQFRGEKILQSGERQVCSDRHVGLKNRLRQPDGDHIPTYVQQRSAPC
jgi:hypothetical protein